MPTNNAATVARNIRLWRDQNLSPAALSSNLASFARQTRDDLIRTGDAPPSYTTIVDGRRGAAEDSVRPDGAIVYVFNLLGLAATYALTYCINRSPVDSGAYKSAWIVAVDGQKWTGDLNDIPQNAEVMVTNPLPYSRKIDVGHMRMSVPPGIVEGARQATRRKFPTIDAARQMVVIPASLGGGYVLKGHFRMGYRPNARTSLRKDVRAGEVMTYPALILSARL